MTSQLSVLNKTVLFLTRSELLMRKISLEAAITLKPSSCPGSAWSPSTVWCVRENQHLQSLGWRFPTPACLSLKEKQNDHSQYTFCLSSLFQMLSASSPLQVCLDFLSKRWHCPKVPWPVKCGGPSSMVKFLAQGSLLSWSTKGHANTSTDCAFLPSRIYLGIQIGNLHVYTLVKLNGDL